MMRAGIVTIEEKGRNDLLLTLDGSAIHGPGRQAVGQFLLQLQVLKAMADAEGAKQLYNDYTAVTDEWLIKRDIVIANKKPRRMFVQANLVKCDDDVKLITYEPTPEGLIQSWLDRLPDLKCLIYENLLTYACLDEDKFV